MKWSFAGVAVVCTGIIGIAILVFAQSVISNNQRDYYNLKEIVEASMTDAVDVAYYRDTGEVKIIEQLFVESFVRRFAESADFNTNGYTLEFYDIMEVPPKVSVVIKSGVKSISVEGNELNLDIVNQLDAILEDTIS